MPANTIYVGRPTKWGNPFKVISKRHGYQRTQSAAHFEDWLYRAGTVEVDGVYGSGAGYRMSVIDELAGKNLACWCPLDQPCHADALLSLANGMKAVPEASEDTTNRDKDKKTSLNTEESGQTSGN